MNKKLLLVLSVVLFSFGVMSNVSAKNEKPKATHTAQVQKVGAKNSSKPLRVSTAKLQEVEEVVTEENDADPEVVEQVDEIQQEQEESSSVIENSLNKVEGRPGFLKFIIGPDYKNAGQVRSEIVQLRNQVAKLTRLRDKMPEEAQTGVDETISALNSEMNIIQTRLSTALEGVSLFGWLNRLLTGFVPEPTLLPSPTPINSASPESSASPSPTATVEATATPTSTPAL